MTLDMALAEIRRCSGTQFDPVVVAAVMTATETGDLQLLSRTGTHAIPVAV